jgi:hypothetical protein
MNIESQKVTLMPIVHQARATEDAKVSSDSEPPISSPVAEPMAKLEGASESALMDKENRKQIAALEKMMGTNTSLIVEKDKERVGWVYKTVDKTTGEVVQIWPQRQVASALMALAGGDARSIMQGMMVNALV